METTSPENPWSFASSFAKQALTKSGSKARASNPKRRIGEQQGNIGT